MKDFYVSEESSQDTKLVFTEDEECLIIRMFNLIGERYSTFFTSSANILFVWSLGSVCFNSCGWICGPDGR